MSRPGGKKVVHSPLPVLLFKAMTIVEAQSSPAIKDVGHAPVGSHPDVLVDHSRLSEVQMSPSDPARLIDRLWFLQQALHTGYPKDSVRTLSPYYDQNVKENIRPEGYKVETTLPLPFGSLQMSIVQGIFTGEDGTKIPYRSAYVCRRDEEGETTDVAHVGEGTFPSVQIRRSDVNKKEPTYNTAEAVRQTDTFADDIASLLLPI